MTADQSNQPPGPFPGSQPLHRDPILESIARAAARLVHSAPPADVVPDVLADLGRAVGVTRVVLDEYGADPGGGLVVRALAWWAHPDHPLPPRAGPQVPGPMPADQFGTWIDTLSRGEIFEGCQAELPEPLGSLLRAWQVQSVVGVPIFRERRLAGALALGEGRWNRVWQPWEKDSLQVFAGIIGSFLQRIESEHALRRSEVRYRQVIDSSAEYIWETDAQGRITYCSARVRDVLGYQPEEVVGRSPLAFVHPEDLPVVKAIATQSLARLEGFRGLEYRALSASGDAIWISTTGVPVLDDAGALVGHRGATTDISDRKRAEEILRTSEERYRGLVESLPSLIVRWTPAPDFRLTFCNRAYFEHFGQTREILGHNLLDTVPPEEREEVRAILERLETPPYHGIHEQLTHSTRGPSWIAWEGLPIRDAAGAIAEFQGIGREFTAERAAAEALNRRDRVLEAVTSTAELLLGAADWEDALALVSGKIGLAIEASRVRIWRLCVQEDGRRAIVPGREWTDAGVPPVDDPRVAGPHYIDDPDFQRWVGPQATEQIVRVTQANAVAPFADTMRRQGVKAFVSVPIRSGDELWGTIVITPRDAEVPWSPREHDALRAAANILGALIQRQRIEVSLRENEEKYRTLVESTDQPIVMLSYDGIVRFANRAAASDFGLAVADLVGRNLTDLFPSAYADQHLQGVREALDHGSSPTNLRYTVVRGHPRWYEVRIQPLAERWAGQRVAMVMVTDVSERKEIERRILEYQARLRSLSSELALTEQRERRRIAAELHDRIGQSLAVAGMKLGALPRARIGPALDEIRALIDQSIQDTRSLTFDLSPPVLYELGLEAALDWLLERFRNQHGFATTLTGDGQAVALPHDILGILFQSIQELLANAAKHARARNIAVSLSRDTDNLVIEIADDGVGFDPQGSGRGGGSSGGFGLFSVRERLDHLGGSLELESQPGQGSRARVRLPLRHPGTPRESTPETTPRTPPKIV